MNKHRWRPTAFLSFSIALHLLALLTVVIDLALWPWALAAVAANHMVITLLGLLPRSSGLGANWTHLPQGATQRNEIALTIDDGPDPEVTPQVLELLQRHNVRATFFCIGSKVVQYPELCREIVRHGHAIENHTQHHRHNFSLLGLAGYAREIAAAQESLGRIAGMPPQFFRAPAGLRNPFLQPVLARLGLQLASWTVRGFDTCTHDAAQVRARLSRGVKPGAILLLHDGNAARTVTGDPVILQVLPDLITSAHAAGLRFVTLRDAAL
ncbi:MAG TPA: polysaccharide deacetylase family protein [Methylophilaceae bacterium]|jgi:peptidoglycan/xylan/chitin deacetylase (PgdA/CDA1 family)|nr:polysaccharide deacetylase family protein [Methylophilaceae bacterium]